MRADKWGVAAHAVCGVCSNESLAFIFIAGPDLPLRAMGLTFREPPHRKNGGAKTAKGRFLSINRSCFTSRPDQARLYGALVKQLR